MQFNWKMGSTRQRRLERLTIALLCYCTGLYACGPEAGSRSPGTPREKIVGPPPPAFVRRLNVGVILVKYDKQTPEPFTREQAAEMMFRGQIKNFYAETSYGKLLVSGDINDIYGWYGLDVPCTVNPPPSSQHVDLAKGDMGSRRYDKIIVMYADCYSGGSSAVGATVAFVEAANFGVPCGKGAFPWTCLEGTIAHELGHALGVGHAGGRECGDRTMVGQCSVKAYNNYFDIMGKGSSWRGFGLHFNAYFKKRLGWLADSAILQVDERGVCRKDNQGVPCTLTPLELPGAVAATATRLNSYLPITYYLEYRAPVGFDANLNQSNWDGLFINVIESSEATTYLLDMSPLPDDDQDWNDVALAPGQTFAEGGASIEITNEGGGKFSVRFPPPVDTTHPTIDSFAVNGVTYPDELTSSWPVTVTWRARDLESGISRAIPWYSPTDCTGVTPRLRQSIFLPADATSFTLDLTQEQIEDGSSYCYGIEIIDNDGNCTTEKGMSCGGSILIGQQVSGAKSLGPIDMIYRADTINPTPNFIVSPELGIVNFTNFVADASASLDNITAPAELEVRWDWENDGVWDTSYTTTKAATHVYSVAGEKTIRLEVRDRADNAHWTTRTVRVGEASIFDPLGDVDGNGVVNSTDANIILSCDAGFNTTAFCARMACGDVNEDGVVNSTDGLAVLSFDAGIQTPFPIGRFGCASQITLCAGCQGGN